MALHTGGHGVQKVPTLEEVVENIGFILTLDNGIRIYHAGDTDYIPEMTEIKNIKLALIPIGGDNLTMNEEEAAMIVNQIKPEIAVPMHYEIKNKENFRATCDFL